MVPVSTAVLWTDLRASRLPWMRKDANSHEVAFFRSPMCARDFFSVVIRGMMLVSFDASGERPGRQKRMRG